MLDSDRTLARDSEQCLSAKPGVTDGAGTVSVR